MAAAIYLLFLYSYKSVFLVLEMKKENIRGRNLVFSKKKTRRKNFPAVQDQMFWLWNVCEQMVMHVRDKSVSSCSLVYSGMHLGQLDKSYLFFIVLRSKLPGSRHQKFTDLERAAVCWIPKLGMFLNLWLVFELWLCSVSFESMLIMRWVYRRVSWVIIAVQLQC